MWYYTYFYTVLLGKNGVHTILIQLSLLFKETLWLYSMGVKINLPESPLEQKGYLILLLTSWKQYEQLVIFFSENVLIHYATTQTQLSPCTVYFKLCPINSVRVYKT